MIGFRDDGLESLRSKLRNLTEAELVQFGKTLRDKWDKSLSAEQIPKEFADCGTVPSVGMKAICPVSLLTRYYDYGATHTTNVSLSPW